MRQNFKILVAKLRALQLSDRGVAAVEFALIFPFLLTVYLGGVEGSTLIIVDRKVQTVAGAVGDLVARSDKVLTTSQLRDYFRAASGIMTPYSSQDVLQIVTAVKVDATGKTSVEWSSQFQGTTYSATSKYVKGRTYPLPEAMIAVSYNKTVIATEASYSYKPLYGLVFNQAFNLNRANYYLPRFEGTITLTP